MRCAVWFAWCGVCLLGLVGCGSKSGNDAAANAQPAVQDTSSSTLPDSTSASKPEPIVVSPQVQEKVAKLQSPDAVVMSFLSAMRDGDEQTITALLSNKAREATGQHEELAIQPPGSPESTYRVETVELVDNEAGAHVSSIWSEPDGQGGSVEYEVVWVLRRETDGWRIAGMATMIEEGSPPLFLNFENPEEMLALLTAAQQRRVEAEAAAYQAQNPAVDPNAPVQR
ncbi:MAG: nuclear transport factor 2 family protein [Pirellulaceae bacterium]|nr:nuclear transport factor 2 family protein [Planctomycetales bacterium]